MIENNGLRRVYIIKKGNLTTLFISTVISTVEPKNTSVWVMKSSNDLTVRKCRKLCCALLSHILNKGFSSSFVCVKIPPQSKATLLVVQPQTFLPFKIRKLNFFSTNHDHCSRTIIQRVCRHLERGMNNDNRIKVSPHVFFK